MHHRTSWKSHVSCGILLSCLAGTVATAQRLQLARTPPMGWNSWNHFGRKINDAIVREQAAAMATNGMKAAGYEYINIDDCWQGKRDRHGVIHGNERFPDMKALANYIHSLGLKFGIYSSPGPKTCAGYEGSYGHEAQDAQTYAAWGVDYLKYDWCTGSRVYTVAQMPAAYRKMHKALVRTARPIVYSLSVGGFLVWRWGASVGGNLWRTDGDIKDNFTRMAYLGFGQNGLEKFAGPGHWNDPDMLEIGNGHMTSDEYRTHMSLWCILAAPLIAGNDLTQMSPTTLEILTNPEVIAIDQDPAGIQGHRLSQEGGLEIWMKPLADGSRAVALFNRSHPAARMTLRFRDIGLGPTASVRDLWARKDGGTFKESFTAEVPQHGVVLLKIK